MPGDSQSEKADLELTPTFYNEYATTCLEVLTRLCEANPEILPETVLHYTQMLLDRVLFCAFSEDRGLLLEETLKAAFEHHDPYNPKPVWENVRGLFRAVDEGREAPGIPHQRVKYPRNRANSRVGWPRSR